MSVVLVLAASASMVCSVAPPARAGGRPPEAVQKEAAPAELPPQVSEAVVGAPRAEVWKIFSTCEGWRVMGVSQCEIDWRVGGVIRTHYTPAPKATLGDAGTIENEILAFEPGRMLAIRIGKTPESFPFPSSWQGTWTVITLEDAPDGRTLVRLSGLGYRDTEESRKMREFFQKGNDWVLSRVRANFAPAAGGAAADSPGEEPADPIAILAPLAGSDYISELPGGEGRPRTLLRVRWERGPSPGFLVGRGWIGGESGLSPHALMVVGADPATGAPCLWNFGDRADIARGGVRAVRPDAVELDWSVAAAGKPVQRYRVELEVRSPELYVMKLFAPGKPEAPMVETTYRRVETVPAEYLRERPAPSPEAAKPPAAAKP